MVKQDLVVRRGLLESHAMALLGNGVIKESKDKKDLQDQVFTHQQRVHHMILHKKGLLETKE